MKDEGTVLVLPGAGVLVEELTPAPDPWEACGRLVGAPPLLFLDSARPGGDLGRWSFVLADPFSILRSRGGSVQLDGSPLPGADPFAVLERLLRDWALPSVPGIPFPGGAAGLWGYPLCHHLEHLPRPARDEFGLDDLVLGFYDRVLAFDHLEGRAWLVSTGLPETDPVRRSRRAARRLAGLREQLVGSVSGNLVGDAGGGTVIDPGPRYPVAGAPGVSSNFEREGYLGAVRRAVEYVHAGDCFQVNLSQRLLARATRPARELYGQLRQRNPAPFAAYFEAGDFAVASASPERFVKVQGGVVTTRPIKGTRPRGATPAEDERLAGELRGSTKDRAENVMIVDLLRNDLGRVCSYGSVRVESVCKLESYQHVHHLVSEVRGELRPGLGPVDLLRAAFPGGSVTGAPKVRAMEVIAELEGVSRGPYCGSLGYVGFDGTADTSILIRTFTMAGGWVQFPVGGGVVADSDPAGEYAETLHKAEGLLRALR